MRNRTVALLAMLLMTTAAAGAELFEVDNAHSFLEFSTRLVGFNRVKGRFGSYSAHVWFDEKNPTASVVSVTIDVGSINTEDEERDKDLKDPDFFDAARFPKIRFDSKRVIKTAGGYEIEGRLNVRDVSRTIRIPIEVTSVPAVDPFGNRRFAIGGRFKIDRNDFGVKGPDFWNKAISSDVEIEFELAPRRWDYEKLGFSSKPKSAGKWFLDERTAKGADAALTGLRDLWKKEGANTEWTFRPGQFTNAAGRLSQSGQHADAAALLGSVIDLGGATMKSGALAGLRSQRAEELLALNRAAEAKVEIESALHAAPDSSEARAMASGLGIQLPANPPR